MFSELSYNQRGGLMDKTLELSAERSGVRIPGRCKCSRRTIAVDAKVNYPLYLPCEGLLVRYSPLSAIAKMSPETSCSEQDVLVVASLPEMLSNK